MLQITGLKNAMFDGFTPKVNCFSVMCMCQMLKQRKEGVGGEDRELWRIIKDVGGEDSKACERKLWRLQNGTLHQLLADAVIKKT